MITKNDITNFTKGWIIGKFEPTLLDTSDFEIAIKHYKVGDTEELHHHKIATEYTVIVVGEVIMNEVSYKANDIIIIPPNESTDFKCLTDVITVVIKTPSVSGDKYITK
jgi:mannose-6-phosphate isomerase-like protein (cupin superfamily)